MPDMSRESRPGEPGIPLDTSPEAHRLQRELYLKMGGSARVAIAFQLAETTRHLTMAGVRRRHPGYTHEEVRFAWARISLGDDLCRAVWPDRPLVDP
jgi:hypothetical protein